MVVTHLSGKAENMAGSEEIRNYLSDVMKPLATYQWLEKMLSKLKEKIMSKSEEKFEQQKYHMDKLEKKLVSQANRIDELEG